MKPTHLLLLALLAGGALLAPAPAWADEMPDTGGDDGSDDDDDDDEKGCSSAAAPASALSVLVGMGLVFGLRRREEA